MDIGTPERYLQASWDILEGRVETESRRRSTATGCSSPRRPRSTLAPSVSPPALIEAGSAVASGARIGPRAVIGAGLPRSARARSDRGSVLTAGCRVGERRDGRGRDPRRGVERRRRRDVPRPAAVIGEGARDRRRGELAPERASPRARWRRERRSSTAIRERRQRQPARRRPRPARPPARRALAGRVGAARAVEARGPRRLRHGRLGDRRRPGRRRARETACSKPLDGRARLRAAAPGRRPTAPSSARATRATPRRRSPATRPPRRSARSRHRRHHRRRARRAARARRRPGDRPAGGPAAARRGRLHVRGRRRGRRAGRGRARRSAPRSTAPPPTSRSSSDALVAARRPSSPTGSTARSRDLRLRT